MYVICSLLQTKKLTRAQCLENIAKRTLVQYNKAKFLINRVR